LVKFGGKFRAAETNPGITMADTTYTVVVIDDYEGIRSNLRFLLEEMTGFQILGEANNGRDGVALCQHHCPDIALVDIMMPIMNGVEAARQINDVCPATKIIGLTASEDEAMIQAMYEAGAWRCFEKDMPLVGIRKAILEALESR
jgi:DNA-binding NarL/FixJ family response regulator